MDSASSGRCQPIDLDPKSSTSPTIRCLLQTHSDVVASIEAISPSTDDVIAGSSAETRHALLDCELEKKGEDLFFGCTLESDRTARWDVMPKRRRRTDLLADRQIEHNYLSTQLVGFATHVRLAGQEVCSPALEPVAVGLSVSGALLLR